MANIDTIITPFTEQQLSVGSELVVNIVVTHSVAPASGVKATVKIEIASKPTSSSITLNNNGNGNGFPIVQPIVGLSTYTPSTNLLVYTYADTTVATYLGKLTIKPDVIGTYIIKVSGYGAAAAGGTPALNGSVEYLTIIAEGTPVLTSQPAVVNVSGLSAALKCLVNPQNRNAVITCTVLPATGLTISPAQTLNRGTTTSTLTFNVTDIALGTYTYKFTATDAADAAGVNFTEIPTTVLSFTLVKKPDAFPTALTTGLTGTTATLRGSVKTNGSDTNVYFEYSTNRNFADEVNQAAVAVCNHNANNLNAYQNVESAITGLSRNEQYYFRLVVENSAGVTTSNSLGFSTTDVPEIDPDKIVVEFGKVTLEWSDGGAEEYEVRWDIINTFTAPSKKYVSENRAIITDLTNGTAYFFQVRVYPNGQYSNTVKLIVATTIRLNSFTPQSGSFMGGTEVSIYGENLLRVISVTFETYPEKTAAEITSKANNKLVVKLPAISNLIPVMNRLKINTTKSNSISNFNKGKITLTDDKGNRTESTTDFVYTVTPTTSGSVCFPAHATVTLKDGRTKTMADLALGDHIQVSPSGECSEVYLFTHALPTAEANFLTFTLASGLILTLTPCHYIYINGTLMAAEKATLGDTVESTKSLSDRIEEITMEREIGLYNPHTLSGDIMVNNVRTSTYTHVLPAKLAHAILEPVRFLYKLDKLF